MDPIAHTLVGATLAQTGVGRRTAYGTAVLVIGANLPDIDGLSMLIDRDTALVFRRGWTHGILALAVLPLLLAGLVAAYEKLVKRAATGPGPPFRIGRALGLSYLAFATHPALDWLNNYGMRWLMPFQDRWFYGDSVFIVDPWIWIVLGGSLFLFHSRGWRSVVGWSLFAAAASALLFRAVPGLLGAKLLWVAALALLVFLRLRSPGARETAPRRIAVAALCLTSIYIGAMVASARYARQAVASLLRQEGIEVERLMVGPVPATPFVRDVVVQTPEVYRYGRLRLFPRFALELEPRPIPRLPSTAVVRAATESEQVRGFMNWARFPFAEVEEQGGQLEVYLLDARYTRTRVRGFGGARVVVPEPVLDD